MKLKIIPISLFFIVMVQISIYAQTSVNPFYSGKTVQHITARRQPLFRDSKFYSTIAEWQKSIRGKIANFILSLKKGRNLYTVIIILLISFLYGIIHALGPGHRKTVLFSYFMARDAKPRDGIMAGFFLSILHAGSAIVLILLLYLIIKGSFLNQKVHAEIIMEEASYGSIAAIGFLLIIYKVFLLLKKREKSANAADNLQTSTPRLILPIMLSGLVPCPGASSIMIFSLAAGFIMLGILGVIAMSFGMAVTISTVSVLSILGKKRILTITEKHHRLNTFIHEGIEISGAVIILLFGLLMIIPFLTSGAAA